MSTQPELLQRFTQEQIDQAIRQTQRRLGRRPTSREVASTLGVDITGPDLSLRKQRAGMALQNRVNEMFPQADDRSRIERVNSLIGGWVTNMGEATFSGLERLLQGLSGQSDDSTKDLEQQDHLHDRMFRAGQNLGRWLQETPDRPTPTPTATPDQAPFPMTGWESRAMRGQPISRRSARDTGPTSVPNDPFLWPQGIPEDVLPPDMVQRARWRRGNVQDLHGMSTMELRDLQRRMEQAGILQRPYIEGVVDAPTMDSYAEVLGWANYLMVYGVDRTLDDIMRMQIAAPDDPTGTGALPGFEPFQRQDFQAPVFAPPSPEAVAQTVRAAWEGRIGRELSAEELARFNGQFLGMAEDAFDQMVDWERRVHEHEQSVAQRQHMSEQRAMRRGPAPMDSWERQRQMSGRPEMPDEEPHPGSPPSADPESEFAEWLVEQFRPEAERIRQRDQSVDIFNLMQQSLSMGDRIMG